MSIQAREARRQLDQGRYADAVASYRQAMAEMPFHADEVSTKELLRGLAESLLRLERRSDAAAVLAYMGDLQGAVSHAKDDDLAGAEFLSRAGQYAIAAERYLAAGHPVLAAIAYEQGKNDEAARRCWEQACRDPRLGSAHYEEALVHFNLGYCCLRLKDEGGHAHLVTAQHRLEEVADAFETTGQRERAFDCYQILLELGRRSGAFENLAEGYINCIRILKEDQLKYYVLQYYEDFLREAKAREEYHAAASLYREAAEYCLRVGLIYDRHYLDAAAQSWLLSAQKNQTESGPPEMSENAYLAAVDCYNSLGDYRRIGEVYQRLAALSLPDRKRARYASVAQRYQGASSSAGEAPPFPEYLCQAHAYPEIWHMDLVEWEQDGDVRAVCLSVVADPSYPEVVRRRALDVLLDFSSDPARRDRLARVAEGLGELQVYVVLRPLEKLFQEGDLPVQRGVMRALRTLFFKRTFNLLTRGLSSTDTGIRGAALEALGRLHFTHAFDPLVRIFRENEDPTVRATALESVGRISSLEAGDFLIEVLRHEDEPLRGIAKRLLTSFDNRQIVPILRQHAAMEQGPQRAALEEILSARSHEDQPSAASSHSMSR